MTNLDDFRKLLQARVDQEEKLALEAKDDLGFYTNIDCLWFYAAGLNEALRLLDEIKED